MQYRVAHSSRGRLRVRYPVGWLKRRGQRLEARLRALSGVRSVAGSAVTGSLLIAYDPFALAEESLIEQLGALTSRLDAGPRARGAQEVTGASRSAQTVAGGGASLAQLLGTSAVLVGACLPVPAPAIAGLVLAADAPALLRAAAALRERRFDGHVLGASAVVLMVARGNYAASALLSWLRCVGEFIVAKSVVTTRRSLLELVAEPGQRVTRVRGNRRRRQSAADLRPGDVVSIRAGERVPVDGTVIEGEALVNQQTMTGESLPVERRPGDGVFAATSVEAGHIEVRVDRVGFDTAVGRIVEAVETAAHQKSDIQVFAERLADRDVGRTLVLAGAGAAIARSFDAATAILVADYGLAARVGVPTAILASITRASRAGILVKGPTALENLARVDTVVFDKTGTLTSGTPRIARVLCYRRALGERELIRLAAAAEQGFGHPVARAVARLAAERGIEPPPPVEAAESAGLGIDVTVEGVHVLAGSRRFMEARGISLAVAASDEVAAHAVGAAPTFVAADGVLAGMLVLQDELRPEAPAAVRALRARRMRNVIMLSGDHPEPSRVIADSLGLRHHHADLLPEDKARLIRDLKSEGRVIAMVGDGVNDALALSAADVGIAVPGGAAVAMEVADVVLLRGGLDQVVHALDLSTHAIAGVRRTIETASRANMAVVGLASFGLAPPVVSILLSHGSAVAAALLSTAQPGLAPAELATPAPARP